MLRRRRIKTDHGSDDPNADLIIAPTRLFRKLDLIADEKFGHHASLAHNMQIDASLLLAARSFAARWVPATKPARAKFVLSQWRLARRDMLRVINRPSYRSGLTLYLFGQTPVPLGLDDGEEGDGINGTVCIQTALKMIQKLRGRLRSLQFDASTTSTSSAPPHVGRDVVPMELDLENRACWAAVIWDTSASLAQNVRSSLITGLKGGCSEPTWVVTRSFLVGSWESQAKRWRRGKMTGDTTSQALAAAAIARLYMWRTVASLKEGLVEGETDDAIRAAWEALCDARDIYTTTVAPVLRSCEKWLDSLSQETRLRWYEETLQYCMGILILVDAVQAAERSDFLTQLEHVRAEAAGQLSEVIEMGLKSSFVMDDEQRSFVAVDPYPHYCLAALQLLVKAGTCDVDMIRRALQELPDTSKSVSIAREALLNDRIK